MSEETESPMEKLTEELHHEATHGHETWLKWSALLSALFAVLAAVAGLKSAQFSNEAMIAQLQASDQWSYYQAKGIKAEVLNAEADLLARLGRPAPLPAPLGKYKEEQQQIETSARAQETASRALMERHEILSRAVTLFQVSIAVIAISVLTRRRHFVWLSAAMAALGVFFLAQGLW